MNATQRRAVKVAAMVAAAGFGLAACGEGGSSTDTAATGGGGKIVVSGSSTVEPITSLVAELYSAENPGVAISVDGPGTGDGFKLFCNGETDISDASRAIKDEEKQACQQSGVEFVELKVAYDGLSVITSRGDDAVACLDFKDLYALLGPESQGFSKWSDADALGKEIGAKHAPYPDAPLQVTAPGEESGTYDSFVEIVISKTADERGQKDEVRADYTSSPNDNVIIEGISASESSLGWVGLSFVEENLAKVKAIPIAGKDGSCVEPGTETVQTGKYPISRPLFIYVNKNRMKENANLASFVDFYLSDEGIASVEEVKYVPLTDDQLQQTRDAWSAAGGA